MQIADNKVISIYFTLTDADGEILDSSADQPPLDYLHGHNNLVDGLEVALTGKAVGDTFTVTLQPEEAYGLRNDELVQEVPRSVFEGIDEIEVGMQFEAQFPSGPRAVTIAKIAADEITIDANHPLAGETLTFEVEVAAIREASDEEIGHGHAHGPEGHHH